MKRLLKELVIVLIAALTVGCTNNDEDRDWDDDKLLVLGAMYDHFNENHLKPGRSICMTSAQIQAKTGMDSARVNQLLKHLAEITGLERRIDNEECADGFKIDAFGRALVRDERHKKAMLSASRRTAIYAAVSGSVASILLLVVWYFIRRRVAAPARLRGEDAEQHELNSE